MMFPVSTSFSPLTVKEHLTMRMKTLIVGLLFAICLGLFAGPLVADEKKPAWKPLMDGKTLKGWHPVGDGKWTVEDGVFVGRANKEKLYGLLVSDKQYKDFSVRFKFKVAQGDSGFYIRTIIKKPDEAYGLQVQVGKAGSGVGGIYESYGRGWIDFKPSKEKEKKFYKDDDWNVMTIDAVGGSVVVQVNGVKTAELKDDPGRPEGHFALQMHSGNVMHVMFKDIEMLAK
jgi:3-keto-disaccharide hydrolase